MGSGGGRVIMVEHKVPEAVSSNPTVGRDFFSSSYLERSAKKVGVVVQILSFGTIQIVALKYQETEA